MRQRKRGRRPIAAIEKCPTGIQGLDDITLGGLPKGRSTLVCGGAGSGKTMLATEFLVRGIMQYQEPGVFMGFEETVEELVENVAAIGFDLQKLIARKKLAMDYVYIERAQIEETGQYDLEGLFVRLNEAIQAVGAKRVVLDTIEALFAGLSNAGILRAELRRLFRWLKDKGVTAVITGESGGESQLTRHGLEEYISDCVIFLDHRVEEQVPTRRLRIIKYRGTSHGMNEYPFLFDQQGITVVPITSIKLDAPAPVDRISSGIPQLDTMLGGKGYYRGSTILVTGSAGSGKTSLAAHFVDAACRRGEKALYCSTEESSAQILRDMNSIGINLKRWQNKGLLHFQCIRPTALGLEMYLSKVYKALRDFQPQVMIMDAVTSFHGAGSLANAQAMLMRVVDFTKMQGITGLFISLANTAGDLENGIGISSFTDTWLLLRNLESSGERNRGLYILKSRGMAHSNQIREFRLTARGIQLANVYLGPSGVLTGSERALLEAKEKAATQAHHEEIKRLQSNLEFKRQAMESRIAAQRAEFAADAADFHTAIWRDEQLKKDERTLKTDLAKLRSGNSK